MGVIPSRDSLQKSDHEQFTPNALSLTKNKRILHCTFYVWDFCLIPKRRGQQFPIYWLAQEKMNILDIFLSFAILSLDLEIVHTLHRRKVNKEEKAKVVAAAWGLI